MDIARLRLHNQRLLGPRFDDAVEVVRWLGAVQAQDYQGAKWALAQRATGLDNAALDTAFDRGEILRTHVMRPTWHFVTPEDIRWLLELTAPRVRSMSASYNRKLELDSAVLGRCRKILSSALRGGQHLTRKEIASALEKGGITASGPRLGQIMMHAELDALICSGPLRGKQFTYALLEERVAPAPILSRDVSLETLTRRYFQSHGPATLHDYAWWSGLTMGEVRAGIEMVGADLENETQNGKSYWLAPRSGKLTPKRPVVHLLPNYDENIVAYRDHSASFDAALFDPRGVRQEALIAHIVTLNGLVAGGWRRALRADRVTVQLDMLMQLSAPELNALDKSLKEYGRFLGLPAALS